MASTTDKDKTKDKDKEEKNSENPEYEDEEIEKILETKISTGYSSKEIKNIIKAAKNVHVPKESISSKSRPVHRNKSQIVYDHAKAKDKNGKYYTIGYTHPLVYFEVNQQPLHIQIENTITPDIEIAETRLHSGFSKSTNQTALKHLYFQGDAGLTIDCTAIVRTDEVFIGKKVYPNKVHYEEGTTVASVLMEWSRNFIPCELVTEDPLIDKSVYRMKINEVTHLYHNTYEFDLTFIEDTYNYYKEAPTESATSLVDNVLIMGTGTQSTNVYSSKTLKGTTLPKRITAYEVALKKNKGVAKQEDSLTKLENCIKKSPLSQKCRCIGERYNDCTTTKYVHCVWLYQSALIYLGFYPPKYRHDGLFCLYTKQETLKMQHWLGVEVDGIVGKQTFAAMKPKLTNWVATQRGSK